MDTHLEAKFARIGSRAKVTTIALRRWRKQNVNGATLGLREMSGPVRIDIKRDGDGEYFDVVRRSDVDVDAIDLAPSDRHLLLQARRRGASSYRTGAYLCGHDERSWFVAAIPESARARSVQSAKDALKPEAVWDAIREYGVSPEDRDLRRTAGFVRQGEWFFIPRPGLRVQESSVRRNEPISRGTIGSKPHWCQRLYREGGELVWVSDVFPGGLTDEQYGRLDPRRRARIRWVRTMRNPRAFARGTVRHPDHKTIWLPYWHQIEMNTESKSRAMAHVAFID